MSSPTPERFNYSLRPAKNMERKMLCEALARLSRISPLPKFRYVGFGGYGFHDFAIFHQRLGIRDMVSIEGHIPARDRVEFNRPYSCIKMRWGMSHQVLPTLTWKRRSIVWLDYDKHLDLKKIEDIQLVAKESLSGSVLIVTVTADPGEIDTNADMAERRLEQLTSRVGAKQVPFGTKGTDLTKWGTAVVYRQIIHNAITKVLSDWNAPREPNERKYYEQIFNFHYADGTKMLTVGGIIVNERDRSRINGEHFRDLLFYSSGNNPYLIESPVLTIRELRYLDERLPRLAGNLSHPNWLPDSERQKYGKVYRYFPAFSEVEM